MAVPVASRRTCRARIEETDIETGRTISLAQTRKEFIHARWSPSNRAIPSIRKGSLFVRGFIVRSSNASKCRSGRRLGRVMCYQLYNTYVGKL